MSSVHQDHFGRPAHLSFLAIFNPSLGPTEETFKDQLVYYFPHSSEGKRTSGKASEHDDGSEQTTKRRAQEDEQLRQIGLAQGMLDFARSFSNGQPVNSIETEKCRIVLHELEAGWWILASVALTVLSTVGADIAISKHKSKPTQDTNPVMEYSSRDVSPPALLLAQLQQAHQVFTLHHGPSLTQLYTRLSRDAFCSTLKRYWGRFVRGWDVILTGSPAVDIFGGLKLASGGELGFGVGEEDWGSGEREVLEDLIRRTDGLVDATVSRFGNPSLISTDHYSSRPDNEVPPWLGQDQQCAPSDGLIFSGVGAISRHSLRDISLWMRQIYRQGYSAYGVRDNPLRERRKRKRLPPRRAHNAVQETGDDGHSGPKSRQITKGTLREGKHKPDTSHQSLLIPAPIVVGTQASTDTGVNKGVVSASEQSDVDHETDDGGTTLGIPDNYMKYLTLGLSTFAKPSKKKPAVPSDPLARQLAVDNIEISRISSVAALTGGADSEQEIGSLAQLTPMPDGELHRFSMAHQRAQEDKGYFLIGLTGDLDDLKTDNTSALSDDDANVDAEGSRILLRTLHVGVPPSKFAPHEQSETQPKTQEKITDGNVAETATKSKRLRTVVYIHRPFIYCFLFEDRTSSLQLANFYLGLRHVLAPIHRPLLSSTDSANVAKRVESLCGPLREAEHSAANKNQSKQGDVAPIHDLLYNDKLLTLHTSIPNIPDPGTMAAEGMLEDGSGPSIARWTRADAVNVHSQIIAMLADMQSTTEIERMSKTNRGWWVACLRPQHHPEGGTTATSTSETENRSEQSKIQAAKPDATSTATSPYIAFLVRKATDAQAVPSPPPSNNMMTQDMLNTLTLGLSGRGERDKTGGTSAGWGPAALTRGIGVDARQYVEGLLGLCR